MTADPALPAKPSPFSHPVELALAGDDAVGLLTHWREPTPDWAPRPHAQGQTGEPDRVAVLLPSAVATVLKGLPSALRCATPPGWPTELADGFHPLHLEGPRGPVNVLLCIGPVGAQLKELVCSASRVWVSDTVGRRGALESGGWTALARCCRRGALLSCGGVAAGSDAPWVRAGFQPQAHGRGWIYQPPWPQTAPPPTGPDGIVAVIGAGLVGAALAWSLTRQGWQVLLIDEHPAPAGGASGLPLGLMTEHRAGSDTVLSALSRTGVPLHERHLGERLTVGNGWRPTWVANLKGQSNVDLPALGRLQPTGAGSAAPFMQPGGLVRPGALVNAWLSDAERTGRLTARFHHRVVALTRANGAAGSHDWELTLNHRHTNQLGRETVRHVVVAAAYGSLGLLSPWVTNHAQALPLRPVKGQLTFAPLTVPPMAACPVRHQGVWVPWYQDRGLASGQPVWAVGSTYERGVDNAMTTPESREANLRSLQTLSDDAWNHSRHQAAAGELQDWAGVRCASLDRLPLVGALPARDEAWAPSSTLAHIKREPGLWTACAMGSRGLTLAALAAELIAAQLAGKPWPVMRSHADALDPARFALRHRRRTGGSTAVALAPLL